VAKIGLKTAHESVVKAIFVNQNPKHRALVLVNFLQQEHSRVFQQYQVKAEVGEALVNGSSQSVLYENTAPYSEFFQNCPVVTSA